MSESAESPPKTSAFGRPDPQFWSGRRVLLTGHTGFKGSWLALWLNALGAEVTGYGLMPPTTPSLYEQADVGATLSSIIADVRDITALLDVVRDVRPEVVFHLAAQSVVKRGYADPIETYSSNVMGTVHLLEAVRLVGVPCVVVTVTSDKCYAHRADNPFYREDDPMGGDDPYSNSKGCAELVTHAYRQSFFPVDRMRAHGVAVATARAGNAIGGGDWTSNQLIPDLIRSFAGDVPCPIRNPRGVRPWQFVLEPLRGYLVLAESLLHDGAAFASGWNFGPDESDAKPVSWIADRLSELWGGSASWVRDAGTHPSESPVLRLDVTKSATRLGWRPTLRLDSAMEWIVEWYIAWRARADLADLTRTQISRYERMLAPEAVVI